MAQREGILADLQIIIYNRLVVFQLCTKASCSFYQFIFAFVNMLKSKTQIEAGEMGKKTNRKKNPIINAFWKQQQKDFLSF